MTDRAKIGPSPHWGAMLAEVDHAALAARVVEEGDALPAALVVDGRGAAQLLEARTHWLAVM